LRIMVAIEQHFVEYRGAIYTDFAFAYPYWQEYLEVFDKVCPIARVRKLTTLPDGWQRADGPNVCFIPITEYRGFWDFLRKMPRVLFDCLKATRGNGCYLLRMGNISTLCWLWLFMGARPYAFEAVGHGGQSVLTVKNVKVFGLNRLIAFVGHALAKIEAKFACCASYVSKYVQGLYPTRNRNCEWVFSSVNLDEQVITGARTAKQFQVEPFHIISVGRLEPEKGHLVLVKAVEQLFRRGYKLRATIIGPGTEIDNLQSYVERMGLSGIVGICGAIPWGPELFAMLDQANLFVLPSFTEGMPRALLEAMARGLPAVGSDVGGIKELLSEECRVAPKDDDALAEKIAEVIDDPERLALMSQTNFRKAMEYKLEIMNRRKTEFWQYIRNFSRKKDF
jgi:glycosyltransferase involved in cell wall biosynthesis